MDQVENDSRRKEKWINVYRIGFTIMNLKRYPIDEVSAMHRIEILGIGCLRCAEITERAKRAVKELGIDAEIIKVEDLKTIANYGVLALPALAVDGVVKMAGNVPEVEEIKEWIKKEVKRDENSTYSTRMGL
jgi:small redox-active disulfide protein 2